ncbi:tetratricopeptide repeat protein [Streptomyces sp. NPDC006172]|uniref:tetratricopeptide repeat protein n=1 Tax=Streptomyces sp. NPDC006172 TaxID=3154470 RepID=UPI0033D78E35
MPQHIVADRLRELWKAAANGYRRQTGRHLTQVEAAQAAGLRTSGGRVANQRLSAWLKGDELPDPVALIRLVKTLLTIGALPAAVETLHPGQSRAGRTYEHHWHTWLREDQAARDRQRLNDPVTASAPAGEREQVGGGEESPVTASENGGMQGGASAFVLDRIPPRLVGEVFVGRTRRLRSACALLDSREFSGAVVVKGAAGVGKTAFAVQVAQRCLRRGSFPGGFLFLDLEGYDRDRRVATDAALAGILPVLGTSPQHIPWGPGARLSLYHRELTRLASERGRMLLLVDNMADPQQLADLLPPAPHVLLVTSRQAHTAAAQVRLIHLASLDPAASVSLIASVIERTLGRRPPLMDGPDADALTELARLCDHLPLALRLMAARLATYPADTVEFLNHQLSRLESRARTAGFENSSVSRSLHLSYEFLGAEQRRAFRLISLHPGRHLSSESSTALLGLGAGRAQRLLLELRDLNVLMSGAAPGWFRMHDLVRSFGLALASEHSQERRDAVDRVLDHYERCTRTITARFQEYGTLTEEEVHIRKKSFLGRMDRERTSMVQAVRLAQREGQYDRVCRMAFGMAPYFRERFRYSDWILTAAAAVESSGHTDDRVHAAAALNMGEAAWAARDFSSSVSHHRQALEVFARCGDVSQRISAGIGLGSALWRLGHMAEAEHRLVETERLAREVGGSALAQALNALGNVWADSGKVGDAVRCQQEATAIHEQLRRTVDSAMSRVNLASSLWKVGERLQALDILRHAVQDVGRWGDPFSHLLGLTSLANALANTGDYHQSQCMHREAREGFRHLGDQYGVGRASWNLAQVLRLSGAPQAETEIRVAERLLSLYEHQHGHTVSIIALEGAERIGSGHDDHAH